MELTGKKSTTGRTSNTSESRQTQSACDLTAGPAETSSTAMRPSVMKLFRKRITSQQSSIAKLFTTVTARDIKPDASGGLCLTSLPAEIRIRIYAALLPTPYLPPTNSEDGPTDEDHVVSSLSPSLPTIHSLRLTSHLIKQELDHELIHHSVAQIHTAISALKHPLGYCAVAHDNATRHEFWAPGRAMLIMDPTSKLYKHMQDLRLTTYLSEWYLTGGYWGKEIDFLCALPACVRSVTLTVAVPEHIHYLGEDQVDAVISQGVNTTVQALYGALIWICLGIPRMSKEESNAWGGVTLVKVNFPAGLEFECKQVGSWKELVRKGRRGGLRMKQVQSEERGVESVVFKVLGAGSVTRRQVWRWGAEKAWEMARERMRE